MQITWRWYGSNNDDITLSTIKQIPNVKGIVWSLHHKQAGEIWEEQEIEAEVKKIKDSGFSVDVVESVNVHDDIKIGLASRDHYIDIYIDTIRKLAKVGVKVICYNFMPVFDWTRTDLYHQNDDGSNSLYYEKSLVEGVDAQTIVDRILKGANDKTMPGWEPERLAKLQELFDAYKDVTETKLQENLKYFLERIIPICEEVDVKMAIHPDDPPWPIFNLPRIARSYEHLKYIVECVDSPCNGLTVCTGSLGASGKNDLVTITNDFKDKIFFMHIRNVKRFSNGDFVETSHKYDDGDIDIIKVMKTLHNNKYKYYIRADHGRHLWGEEKKCRPGYGLYDRALGVMYLNGIWDTLEKSSNETK